MARSLDQERAAITEEEQRLEDRRRRLAERERDAAIEAVDRAGLLKADLARVTALMARIGRLGLDETEKRLDA